MLCAVAWKVFWQSLLVQRPKNTQYVGGYQNPLLEHIWIPIHQPGLNAMMFWLLEHCSCVSAANLALVATCRDVTRHEEHMLHVHETWLICNAKAGWINHGWIARDNLQDCTFQGKHIVMFNIKPGLINPGWSTRGGTPQIVILWYFNGTPQLNSLNRILKA